ncbi:hypothetical protein RF11_08584 [Thelohanellus kitauei]|uniref:Uncharacterized protein n=1 Tax=Thelohanellus kitauei TaxID=669202 RepID=A0A0C2JFJ7_THEKT|nr:hypothetical protein RF11_08584 [Thelohanellus kitauei]
MESWTVLGSIIKPSKMRPALVQKFKTFVFNEYSKFLSVHDDQLISVDASCKFQYGSSLSFIRREFSHVVKSVSDSPEYGFLEYSKETIGLGFWVAPGDDRFNI